MRGGRADWVDQRLKAFSIDQLLLKWKKYGNNNYYIFSETINKILNINKSI